jgi:trehalose/maltose hydrolase-like predicted phosphorylase
LPVGWSRTRIWFNFPNWLALGFRIGDGDWFDTRTVKLLSYRQELDLRRGMLFRVISFEDGQGRRTSLKERRLVSMSSVHLGALELEVTPRELVRKRHGTFGYRRSRGKRRCQALSQLQ